MTPPADLAALREPCAGLFIPLTKGKFTVVSFEDAATACRQKWQAARWWNEFYAMGHKPGARSQRHRCVSLHRLLLGADPGQFVDHANRDPLDNRRYNLRLCDNSRNQANRIKGAGTSKFKGVSWSKHRHAWYARITVNQRGIWLGSFQDEEAAARAYDSKAIEVFGTFARTNYEGRR